MVKFQVNSKEFDAEVAEALKVVKDLRPAFIQIAREFYKTNRAIFALKSAGKYPDFSGPLVRETWKNPGRPDLRTRDGNLTAYQNTKVKAGVTPKGYPLLRFSGRLEKSITDPSNSDAITIITQASVVLGTSVKNEDGDYYPNFHQSSEPRKKIPFRPFLFLDPTTVGAPSAIISRRNEAWVKAIRSYAFRAMSKLGAVKEGDDV